MKYIALLRGINVGGANKVSMQELRKACEAAGFSNVNTYINSGNLIFESTEPSKSVLATQVERIVESRFGFPVTVVVFLGSDVQAIAKALPGSWTNDTIMKCDVIYLHPDVDNPTILDKVTIKPDIDTVMYVPGAILWAVDRKHVTKSGLLKIMGTGLYKQVTVRNCNTARKLAELTA